LAVAKTEHLTRTERRAARRRSQYRRWAASGSLATVGGILYLVIQENWALWVGGGLLVTFVLIVTRDAKRGGYRDQGRPYGDDGIYGLP